MSEKIDEQLSALLDGELPAEQEELLLRRLQRGEDCRATLVRYSLIGELLRGSETEFVCSGVMERVHRALQAEPPAQPRPVPRTFRWGIPLAGAGLAAALAIVAVLGLGLADNHARVSRGPAAQVAGPVLQAAASRPAAARTRSAIATHRLTTYLVSHGNYAGSLSRQVMNSHIVNSTPVYLRATYQGAVQGD